jgi:agmatine/peptidylarginine deiminase
MAIARIVKSELADVVCTIAKFETVRLLTPAHELVDAKARFGGGNVEIIVAKIAIIGTLISCMSNTAIECLWMY